MKKIISLVLIFSLCLTVSAPCMAIDETEVQLIDEFIQPIVILGMGELKNYTEISGTACSYQLVYSDRTANVTEEIKSNGDVEIVICEEGLSNTLLRKSSGEFVWGNTDEPVVNYANNAVMPYGGAIYYSENPFYGNASDYTDYDTTTTYHYEFAATIQFITLTVFSGVVAAVSPGLAALMAGVQIAKAISDVYNTAQDSNVAYQDVMYSRVAIWMHNDPPNFATTGTSYSKHIETFYGSADGTWQIGDPITYYSKLQVRMIDQGR